MSKKFMTDAGVGRAMFATRIRLSLKAAEMCLFWGAVPMFFATLLRWWWSTPEQDLAVVRLTLLSKVLPGGTLMKLHLEDAQGSPFLLLLQDLHSGRVADWVRADQVAQVFADFPGPMHDFKIALWLAVGLAVAAYAGIWFLLRRTGTGAQDNTRIRGAHELVGETEIRKKVKALGASPYKLVGLPLPTSALGMGIVALGSPGSGKSMAIHDLMLQVFARKKKCVIYDYSGEFYQAHFRPGVDHFFNPALEGSVPWSLFGELNYTYDADTLARSFLPPLGSGNSGEFFRDAARAVFSVLVARLAQRGAVNTADLARAFLEMPSDEMDHLIQKSVASSSIGGDSKQQRQGVISSIAIYLNGIAAVGKGQWTVRDWLAKDDDSRLFILNTRDTAAMFAPLYRLMLSVVFGNIAASAEIVHSDRYWMFLDELHQLGDIQLDEQLATVRKFGVCAVTGLQSDSQLVASMGEARANTLMNCQNTSLLLLAQEPSLQKREAQRLGEMEMNTVNRNQALAVAESRDGAGLNNLEAPKWVVMPSQFGSLKPLTGYVKIMSEPGVFVDYQHWHGSWWRGRRRNAWKPRQKLPPRDPQFLLQRPKDGLELDDIRKGVADEAQAAKAAAAAVTTGDATSAAPAALPATAVASAPTAASASVPKPATADAKPELRLVGGPQSTSASAVPSSSGSPSGVSPSGAAASPAAPKLVLPAGVSAGGTGVEAGNVAVPDPGSTPPSPTTEAHSPELPWMDL